MDTSEPIIVECKIDPYPRPMPDGISDPMPEVTVKFDNGEEKVLFSFYPDTISFKESEFLGLTEEAARTMKFIRFKKFLEEKESKKS